MSLSNYAEAALIGAMFQKTSAWGTLSTPPTIYVGLHAPTTLNAQALASQAVIVTNETMSIGAEVVIGISLGSEETGVVQGVTGAGPYTVTLTANLANQHEIGEMVSFTPADDGSDIIEPVEASYARVATAAVDWNNPVQGNPTVVSNANAVTFPQALEDWAAGKYFSHFLMFDALTAGNYVENGPLTAEQPVLTGNTVNFPVGQLQTNIGGVPF